tara:strand:- start:5886 stop:6533 length:648 start_codon:yes stop_codon:yes gene_type:complete
MNNLDFVEINKLFAFYAPAIICTGVLLFSFFSSVAYKGLFFIFLVYLATMIRWTIWPIGATAANIANNSFKCFTGQPWFQSTGNTTYSTFVIWFSLMYFLIPQIIQSSKYDTSMVNYGIAGFFVAYFVYDILVKKSISCVNLDWTSAGIGRVMADIVGGSALATIIVCLIYYSSVSSLLFINELNSNKEVCTQPSKQQFKCSVYKNGELVKQSLH